MSPTYKPDVSLMNSLAGFAKLMVEKMLCRIFTYFKMVFVFNRIFIEIGTVMFHSSNWIKKLIISSKNKRNLIENCIFSQINKMLKRILSLFIYIGKVGGGDFS